MEMARYRSTACGRNAGEVVLNKISLILPYPPATNNLYFTRIIFPKERSRKPYPLRVLTDEGRQYKETVAQIADGLTPFMGDVCVTFKVFRPRRIGDLDGTFKVILDGLKGFAFGDDEQVCEIHAYRFEDKLRPRVEVEIKTLSLC